MPSYYTGWEVGDFIVSQKLDFEEGSIIKYICRYKGKDGLGDLEKARDYINRLIERRKEHDYQETMNERRKADQAARASRKADIYAGTRDFTVRCDSEASGFSLQSITGHDLQSTENGEACYAPINHYAACKPAVLK